MQAHQTKPFNTRGPLQILCDSSKTGGFCKMAMFVDGKQVAKLDPAQKASFYLSVISHQFVLAFGVIVRSLCCIRNTPSIYRI